MERLNLKRLSEASVRTLLEATSWCDDFSPLQIGTMTHFFIPYKASADTVILKEGEHYDFFALICDGSVNIVKESFSGEKKNLQFIGPGKIFGEMSFFDHSPCSANVIVKEDITLLAMHRPEFQTLSTDIPHLALAITIKIISTISQRLRQTSGKLIDFI